MNKREWTFLGALIIVILYGLTVVQEWRERDRQQKIDARRIETQLQWMPAPDYMWGDAYKLYCDGMDTITIPGDITALKLKFAPGIQHCYMTVIRGTYESEPSNTIRMWIGL
ncbi:MAG: hypothetical protein V3S69_05490 [Dehalococcoidales bacterium]